MEMQQWLKCISCFLFFGGASFILPEFACSGDYASEAAGLLPNIPQQRVGQMIIFAFVKDLEIHKSFAWCQVNARTVWMNNFTDSRDNFLSCSSMCGACEEWHLEIASEKEPQL